MSIVQYWDAESPPGYVADLLATFRDRNPDLRHRVFDELEAAEFIAAHFDDREQAAFQACAVPSMRADYFRYCAVLALGGAYADAGFRCIAPLRPLLEGVDGGVLFRRAPAGYFFNGFFLFRAPAHPFLRLALDVATTNIEQRASEMVQMVTGPWIFSSLAVLYQLVSLETTRPDAADDGFEHLAGHFREQLASLAPTAAGRRAIESMVEPLFEAVGDRARLTGAFEGVRVGSFAEMSESVLAPEDPLPYKQSDAYWINWQRRGQSIFR